MRIAVVACGALALDIAAIAARRGWPVDVHPLPPLLHNQPERIAAEVERLVERAARRVRTVAVGYADCGTYGALDEVCATTRPRAGWPASTATTCSPGATRIAAPARGRARHLPAHRLPRRVVRPARSWRELGLDRYPELRDDYFGHYTRVVWLASGEPQTSNAQPAEPPIGWACHSWSATSRTRRQGSKVPWPHSC